MEQRVPSSGPQFESNRNMRDLPASWAWAKAMGEMIPWFTALFKNSTWAGHMNTASRGISFLVIRKLIPAVKNAIIAFTTGPMIR